MTSVHKQSSVYKRHLTMWRQWVWVGGMARHLWFAFQIVQSSSRVGLLRISLTKFCFVWKSWLASCVAAYCQQRRASCLCICCMCGVRRLEPAVLQCRACSIAAASWQNRARDPARSAAMRYHASQFFPMCVGSNSTPWRCDSPCVAASRCCLPRFRKFLPISRL